MSDQDPLQPPPGEYPPNPGATTPQGGGTPPSYGATPPAYGTNPPQYGATPPVYGVPAPLTDAQTRQWAGLAHLGGILYFLPSLIIWLVYKDRSAFVGQEAKTALNFQIGIAIAWVAIGIADAIFLPFFIASLLYLALWIITIIFSIQGYQAVQRGQAFRYPFSLDLIK